MCFLPQHNEFSILHWNFGGGGGGDFFLLRGVHWAWLIEAWWRMGGEIQSGKGDGEGETRGWKGGGAD